MSRRPLTVGKRISAVCASLIAVTVATSVVALWSVKTLSGNLTYIGTTSLPGIQQITALQSLGLELRGTSLLMGTPGLTAKYRDAQNKRLSELRSQMTSALSAYEPTLHDQERSLFESTKSETSKLIESCQRFQDLASAGKYEEAGAFWSEEGSTRSKAFRKAIQDEVNFVKSGADANRQAASVSAVFSNSLSWTLLVLSVVVGVGLGWFVVRNITKVLARVAEGIRSSAEEVGSASRQVAAASTKLAESSSEQAAAIEETSASGHEINAISRANSDHCQSAVALMTQTETEVNETNHRLDQTVASMKEITSSSERISRIIKVIDEIAFQTNILALNAAVEAARAGSAGMGFAVVADEVRNLAGRCSTAAKDITGLIEESVNIARTGSGRLDESANAVAAMAQSAMKVKTLVHQINEQARQQGDGMGQISKALVQMEQMTQQTAASAEESAAASQQLSSQAASMQGIIESLEALIA